MDKVAGRLDGGLRGSSELALTSLPLPLRYPSRICSPFTAQVHVRGRCHRLPSFILSAGAHPERYCRIFPERAGAGHLHSCLHRSASCCACGVKEVGAGGKLTGQELWSGLEQPLGREAGRTAPGRGP